MKGMYLSKKISFCLALTLLIVIAFSGFQTTNVFAESSVKEWSENFEGAEMVTDTIGGKHQHLNGWKSVSLLGETANASIVKREDATGGNFLRLKHDDSSVLGGAGISTGLKIGTNPIVASFEVYLSGAENGGRQRLRVGFMSTKEPETTQSSVIDFSRNDDGSWGLGEVGSYKSNRALLANLVDDMGKKYVIPAEETSKWHKVQVVYIPALGANAAKVTYCVDGVKLSTSNPNADYVHPADGSLGAFVYVSQNGTHPDSYFGLDNVKVFEYPKEKVKAEYSTVNAGTKQVKYSWCVPVTEIPQNSDISIVKFANAKDMLENNNGTPISVTDIACDNGGMIIDFSEELKGFEQYRITVSEKKNILGNPLGHIFETSVIPVSSSADIETTKAAEYSFDSIDLDMYSNNPGACTVEEFDGDNRLKINADGAVTFSYLNVDIPLDDTGIEYADISFDTKTVWRAAANPELDRFEFGIAQRNGSSSYPRVVLARFFPEIVQASISAVPGDGLGTTPVFVDSVAKSLYKKDDWNSFKIRYYPKNPSDSTIGQYQLYIKNDDGEYVEMLQAAQPAAKPVDGVLAAICLSAVRTGNTYYDNLMIEKAVMAAGEGGVTGIELLNSYGEYISSANGIPAGINKIKIYTRDMKKPVIELKNGNENVDFSQVASGDVYTIDLKNRMLAENQTYTLTIDSTEYTIKTNDGENYIGNIMLADENGECITKFPAAGSKLCASFDVYNTSAEDKTFLLMLAAYEDNALVDIAALNPVHIKYGENTTISSRFLEITENIDRVAAFLLDGTDHFKSIKTMVSVDKSGNSIKSKEAETGVSGIEVAFSDFDTEGRATIKGTVPITDAGKKIPVIIFMPGVNAADLTDDNAKTVICYCDEMTADKNGAFEKDIRIECSSGELTAYFGTENQPIQKKISFSNYEENKRALDELYRLAIKVGRTSDNAFSDTGEKTIADVKSFINDNLTALDFNETLWQSVSQDAMTELLTDYIQKTPDSINEFVKKDKAGARDLFRELLLVEAVIEKNKAVIGEYMSKIRLFTSEDGILHSWYTTTDSKDIDEFATRIIECGIKNNISSTDTTAMVLFENTAIEVAVLTAIHNADGYGEVKNVLERYENYSGILTSGISVAKLTELQGTYFKSYDDVKRVINKKDETPNNPSHNSGGTGSGSGNGKSAIVAGDISQKNPVTPITPTENAGFLDVTEQHWFYESVNALCKKGIINGKSETEFMPGDNISRAETIKLIVSMLNLDTANVDCDFDDVNNNEWFYPYVSAAVNNHLANGIGEKLFDPNAPITRQDLAVMLNNVLSFRNIETADSSDDSINVKDFVDSDNISDYALPAVKTLNYNSVVSGYEDKTFRPQAFVTRAEAAQMIYNFMNAFEII